VHEPCTEIVDGDGESAIDIGRAALGRTSLACGRLRSSALCPGPRNCLWVCGVLVEKIGQ
jgi:hypothetical protein